MERRFQHRKKTNLPVQFARQNDPIYHDATLFNVSQGGMYFESRQKFSQGEVVYLTATADAPAHYAGHAYAARVKWCKQLRPWYQIGAQTVGDGRMVSGNSCEAPFCDCCECRHEPKMIRTGDSLHLCRECFISLSGLPGKSVKSSLNRFLAGNVI